MSEILCEHENAQQTDLESFKSELKNRCEALLNVRWWIRTLYTLSDIEDFITMNTEYISTDCLSHLLDVINDTRIKLIKCSNIIWVTKETKSKIKVFIEDMEEIIKYL